MLNWILSKSSSPPTYHLSEEQRNQLLEKLTHLEKEKVELQQSLREQTTQAGAQSEDLFLELLEVVDSVEALLNYLQNNPDPTPEFIQRLPRSVGAVHRKFLSVLKKQQVQPIEIVENTSPDFQLCRVVEREVRNDLPDQTITKITRRGFYLEDKILRPTEVITSKTDEIKQNVDKM